MRKIANWLHNNGLSIMFLLLFIGSLAVQAASGYVNYNEQLAAHGLPKIAYREYLVTGDFLDEIFTNWQAAILQLECLIFFSSFLYQKGASHSRRPEDADDEASRRDEKKASVLYRNSLSLVFLLLFALSFIAHIIFGTWSYNETRAMTAQGPVSISAYMLTAAFWFKTSQTWEAEFIAMVFFLVLTIFFRQQRSAESKPVLSRDEDTGVTNH